MKLITEQIESVEFLIEENGSKKNHFIEGIFLQSDIKNRNGRVYPMNVLEKEVQRYSESYISKDRALGELGHPEGPTVNLDRVSHKIISLQREGSNFIGKAKLLDTPMGKIAKSLIDEGVKLGVSSRGVGSLQEKSGVNYVRDDFMLATAADIVADPSAPDAFVNGIMEGKEWIWNNGTFKEAELQQVKEDLERVSRGELEGKILEGFERLLSNL